ncbi:MAG TPA: ribosome biogenesis GTP-binding protein YihA/YsxC [Myxococcales bacterium]|nr:ribosome biogenesis GTP-binding protein YihA/YsxC [Myxococcales bacterium]
MPRVLEAAFLITAVDRKGYPPPDRPEIAFVGRSNVGKSSMINALAARKKLVRVSNTPGRTRTLNFFDLVVEADGGARWPLRLADLPGYGFAKASKAERKAWRSMISEYLGSRSALRVVVSIIDAEVGPTADDFQTLDYLAEGKANILVAATKIDRLPKAKRKPRIRELTEQLELPEGAVIPFSATDGIGVEETWRALLGAVTEEPA